MKTEFEKQLKQLLGVRKERTLLMTDDRYNEIIAETKEAISRRRKGLELSGLHYRRLKRFEVTAIGDRERLIQKAVKAQHSGRIYFCMASEMFDVVHEAHLKIGHKKEKGMELELKRKYCNITREVIAIYLNLCQDCVSKKKYQAQSLSPKPLVIPEISTPCQIDIIDMETEPDGVFKFILTYQDEVSKFLILRPLKTKKPQEVADVLFDIFCLIGVPNCLLCAEEGEYCNQILLSLWKNWKVKLKTNVPVQDSIAPDIYKSLTNWMADNQTRAWSSNLRIIQSLKNHYFHPSIEQTPHQALFRNPQTNEIENPLASKAQTEKHLKQQLAHLSKKLEEVTEATKVILKNYVTNNRPLSNCALTDSMTVIKSHRGRRKCQMKPPSDSLGQETTVFTVGDKVMVSIPDDESFEKSNRTIGRDSETKYSILEDLFHTNEPHHTGNDMNDASPPSHLAVQRKVTSKN